MIIIANDLTDIEKLKADSPSNNNSNNASFTFDDTSADDNVKKRKITVHLWINSVQINSRKLSLPMQVFSNLDIKWAEICDAFFKTSRAEEFMRKKIETREWKKDYFEAKCSNAKILPKKPLRSVNKHVLS